MLLIPECIYGVIGWPLAQTLSPLLHNTGFRALDIPAVYLAFGLEPQALAEFVRNMAIFRIRGLSVTIPHKQAVMPFLEGISEQASLAGAVNTLFWRDGALCGENTDVDGFLAPLAGRRLDCMDALILGAGGAAHAAAAGLRLAGLRRAWVCTPGNRRHIALAERFGFSPLDWSERYRHPADLVVNATPMGMKGELVDENPYDFSRVPGAGTAYDLVYNPARTRFLLSAAAAGRETIGGADMFFGQADAQFRIWTGKNMPESSRIALAEVLGEKDGRAVA